MRYINLRLLTYLPDTYLTITSFINRMELNISLTTVNKPSWKLLLKK